MTGACNDPMIFEYCIAIFIKCILYIKQILLPSNPYPLLTPEVNNSLPSHPPTIYSQNLTTNIRARLTRKEDDRALEVLRPSPPPSRYPAKDLTRPILIRHERLIHLRRNISRRDSIDTDPLPDPLITQRLGQLADTAFTRRVRRHIDAALETQQRRDVDDAAAAAGGVGGGGEHMGADVAAQGEDGREVHL